MSIRKEKSNFSLYNTFYSSKFHGTEKKYYNDILKGTKSVLKNCLSFKNYIKNYKEMTEILSFKTPYKNNFPVLNNRSLSLIPISKSTTNLKNDKLLKRTRNKNNGKFHILLSSDDIDANENKNFKLNLKNRIKIGLKSLEEKYENNVNKNKESLEKQNPVIADFFYKWTQKYSLDIKNPKGNNFSSLCYDEQTIFYSNYDDLLKEKIKYMKKNTIDNLQEIIESEFYDKIGRKIKIELLSIKIIFKEISKKTLEANNEQVINLPLSYVFLFYVNGFDFFKKILLSSIYFSNNFSKINFNDKNIYTLIKNNFKREQDFENLFYNEKNKEFNYQSYLKKDTFNYNTKLKIKRSMTINKKLNDNRKNTVRGTASQINKKMDDLKKAKKITIFHVNRQMQKKENEKELLKENNKKEYNYLKDNIYDEFEFIWETPVKSFKVIIQLPIIKLWCQHLNKTVITFCDKNLFLYMFKNNFINWDFYALHYVFSIRFFRKLIFNKYSYKIKPLLQTLIKDKNINNQNLEENKSNDMNNNKPENLNMPLSFLNKILYIRNKRYYNFLNENNETIRFFYTDSFNINSIIEFHSYIIDIDYNGLNPNKTWKFYLNFKQMEYLTLINKYELLETFLPKIIKCNFELGTLDIDFSVFNDFNANILNYKKREVINKYKSLFIDETNNKKNNNMKLVIKNPYVTIEKMVEGINFTNTSDEIELSSKFLNKLRRIKNNILWTKIILKIIDKKDKENSFDENDELNCENRDSKINNDNYDIDEMIEMIHNKKSSRISKSLHFKIKPLFHGIKH